MTYRLACRGACADNVVDSSFSWSIRGALKGSFARRIFPLIVADITIHVEPAEGSLERINHSVMVLVELLKVVVQDFTGLRIWRSTSPAIPAGVIPLRMLEHSMIREV